MLWNTQHLHYSIMKILALQRLVGNINKLGEQAN